MVVQQLGLRQSDRPGGGTVLLTAALLALVASAAAADIAPSQVLVVYNSAAAGAAALKDSYLTAHADLPAANVLDLNNAALNVANLTRAQFVSLVRDPIRNHLSFPGPPTPQSIIAIVLIRPFPHRLLDTDAGAGGDSPTTAGNEFTAGDNTCSSLDADLALLWQDLEVGEAGGQMDSYADNIIDNPFHQSASAIHLFSRGNIQTQKIFVNASNYVWLVGGAGASVLTPGDLYLVCRIDGHSLADAQASIARAQALYVNQALVKIILDEYDLSIRGNLDDDPLFASGDPFLAGDDYEETRDILVVNGWNVRYDATFDFITGAEEPAPIIAYASYGENHSQGGAGENPPGAGTYIEGFHFPPGAIFNTIESYNARALNGLGTLFSQEQAADFIAAGGTFAVGHVFEPFSFTIPDNEFLFVRMLVQGWTWAEAAYAALPCLSWQHVILGDPLAKMTILNDLGLPPGDLNGDSLVDGRDIALFTQILVQGLPSYRAVYPALDPIARADFNGDYRIDLADQPGFFAALLAP